LWLHASEQLNATAAPSELRRLLVQLVPPSSPAHGPDGHSIPGDYGHSTEPPTGTSKPGEEEPVSG
jgi:hypothetical protein